MRSPDKNALQPLTQKDIQDTLIGEKSKLQGNMNMIPIMSKNILKYVKQNMYTVQYAKKQEFTTNVSSDWIMKKFVFYIRICFQIIIFLFPVKMYFKKSPPQQIYYQAEAVTLSNESSKWLQEGLNQKFIQTKSHVISFIPIFYSTVLLSL